MKEKAESYYNLGLNPTCISYIKTKYNTRENNPGKSPSHSWKRWQVRRPTLSEIQNLNWNLSSGIGTVLGFSNRCIDIDDCDDYQFIEKFLKFLNLPKNYEWVVKTPNGFHIHIKSDSIYFATHEQLVNGVLSVDPNSTYEDIFSKIELRWANHAVLPPTIIDGKEYYFINKQFPKESPASIDIFSIFTSLCEFCGRRYNGHGNFESNNMVFQISVPSEGLPYAEAIFGTIKEKKIQDAIHESGYIHFNKLPKNIQVGYIEFGFGQFDFHKYRSFLIDKPFFIDIETTGLIKDEFDYESYPRIIQIAYYNPYNHGEHIIYIKPDGFIVPPEIEKLTGITNSFLIENGIGIKEALESIEKEKRNPVVGFNIDFDLSVIDSEYFRILKNKDLGNLNNKLRDGSQTFCLMKKYSSIFGGKFPKLSELYTIFFDDLPPQGHHNAKNDLEMLIDCYSLMCLYGYIKKDYEKELLV